MELTHRELCIIAAKYLRKQGLVPFNRCQYVVCELERVGESPDAFGWTRNTTQLIEAKVSRSDFLSDKKKWFRNEPQDGIGTHRSYICPEGLIKVKDLPNNWGLLYVNKKGEVIKIKEPIKQQANHNEEIHLITSILRREGITPKIFSYKKYKNP